MSGPFARHPSFFKYFQTDPFFELIKWKVSVLLNVDILPRLPVVCHFSLPPSFSKIQIKQKSNREELLSGCDFCSGLNAVRLI
jgi:hypothetical protein